MDPGAYERRRRGQMTSTATDPVAAVKEGRVAVEELLERLLRP